MDDRIDAAFVHNELCSPAVWRCAVLRNPRGLCRRQVRLLLFYVLMFVGTLGALSNSSCGVFHLESSTFRQVPDNQEVFANAAMDACVIVELLQYEEQVADADSARHFFDEIAHSNGCGPADVSVLLSEPAVEGPKAPTIDAPHSASVIVGDQRVAKFKEGDGAKNVVRVYLGNVRYAVNQRPAMWIVPKLLIL